MENSTAFVTSIPCKLKGNKKTRDQANVCNVRSSAGTVPPTNGNNNNNSDEHTNKLSESRKALERLMNIELKSAENKNGQCECIWCEGSKMRKCSWCKGRGVRYEIVHKSWEELSEDLEKLQSGKGHAMEAPKKLPVTCSACSGTKKLKCRYCRGSGIGSYGHGYQ